MHTAAIIAKTIGMVGLLTFDLFLFGLFVEGDILAERGLSVRQVVILLAVLGCAVGIWFL